MSDHPLYVTRPYLPELEEFIPHLREIWASRILTNAGPYHTRFEAELSSQLGLEHISLFANGTLALVTALQALRISGEVITTAYSFVATGHALLWNGIKPVFVDVEPATLTLNPERIEAAITPQTTAILAVHCYGHPCDVVEIQRIADIYNLKVIYDGAHAFGVTDRGGSVLRHGDLAVLSFHATKVFSTFEGGAIIAHDAKAKQRIDHLKNFGFVDDVTVVAPGINGKMNEFSAALGLLQLQHVSDAIAERRRIDQRYRELLSTIPGIRYLEGKEGVTGNFGYFPILIQKEYKMSREAIYRRLRENGIFARRYFYPLISDFPMYRGLPSANRDNLPVAADAARRVLCLPIYPGLTDEDIDRVVGCLAS